jgi:fucose permease
VTGWRWLVLAQRAVLVNTASTGRFLTALAINVGPLTHDAVPAAIVATATGIVVDEIVDGALAPALAGAPAQRAGITVVPWIAALLLVLLVVREPRRGAASAHLPGAGATYA